MIKLRRILLVGLFILFCTGIKVNAQKNLDIVSTMHFTGQTLAGCWHYEDGSGHKYALIGAQNGIVIVDVTDSVNPVQLFQLPGVSNLWHEVKVEGQFAYAVTEGNDASGVMNGVQVINLSYLPDSAPNKFYTGDGAIAGQLIKAHSITTSGRHVFVNGHNVSNFAGGVIILDISDPWNPYYVGAETLNYCHDSYVRGDTLWTSDIYIGKFSIYNISNPSSPVFINDQPTAGTFNHNTWLSDDSRTIFCADERTGAPLSAYDVTDPHNIELLDLYYTTLMPAKEVHNVRVFHDFLVCADYGSQLTLVDASRPDNLIEIGNFPTGTSLCWDADPYLSNGLILATDMSSGMFYVFQPHYIHACFLEGIVTDSLTGFPIGGAMVTFQSGDSTSSKPTGDYKTGMADSGTYTVTYSRTGYFPKTISGISLQHGLVTQLDVQLIPLSTAVPNTSSDDRLRITPNPANDFLKINSGSIIRKIVIYSMDGKIVKEISDQAESKGMSYQANISGLRPGIYSIRVQTQNGDTWEKFIKE